MHTKKRKFTAILLVLAMLFTLMPALPQAAEAAESGQVVGEYVTMTYGKPQTPVENNTINLNVYIEGQEKPVQTASVSDVAITSNEIAVYVSNNEYEIAGVDGATVSATGHSVTLDKNVNQNLDMLSILWTNFGGQTLSIDITLRDAQTPPTTPVTPSGVYQEGGLVEFRFYDPQLFKMIYLKDENTTVTKDTEIEKVTVNLIREYSPGVSSFTISSGTDREEDYYGVTGSNVAKRMMPENVKDVVVTYDGGKTITIPANELRFVWNGYSGGENYYSVEINNDSVHVVYFVDSPQSQGLTNFKLYDIQFVQEPAQTVANYPIPSYSSGNIFVNWEIDAWDGSGQSFLPTTIVDRDMTVFARKISASTTGNAIHVMNQSGEFVNRLAELSDINPTEIKMDTVKVRIYDQDGTYTNENYIVLPKGWQNNNEYFYVANNQTGTGGLGEYENNHLIFDQISKVEIWFETNNGISKHCEIPIGNKVGQFSKSLLGNTNILELRINQQGDVLDEPDDNKPELPDDGTLFELLKNAVTIDCTNNTANHENKTYDLLEGSFDKGEVQGNAEDGYTFTVTIHPDKYVAEYNKDQSVTHQLAPASQDPKKITLNMAPASSEWTVAQDAIPVTFTVKCDDPTPATYSLKYDANGGTFANTSIGTADVNNLVAGVYNLWAKDESVEDDKQPAGETAWPTHDKDNDTDVVMIGWTAEKDAKIYAKGDVKPNVITTATITNADVTVYAVWGYDTNGNGTPDVEENWYKLTYDANGGDEKSVPVDTNLYQTGDVTLATTPVPTHVQDNEKDVVFIGWSTTQTNKIFAAGEDYGSLVDKVTFDNDHITVYAVWGYDEYGNGSEGGDKIPDAQQVVIIPADITVYTGGDGYTGVLNEYGETVGETENGLPEPGYYFILPYELNAMFGADPDEMVDLTKHLRLNYSDGDDKRSWTLQMYNANDGVKPEDNIANEKYVYRLVPDNDDNSARLEIHDGEDTITSDNDFDFDLTTLYKEYTMNLYTETVKKSLVKVEYNKSGNDNIWQEASDIEGIALGTATLAVRGTSLDNPVTDINDEVNGPVNSITAEQPSNVTYYTNGSIIPVVNQDKVQLLVDEIVGTAQDDLKDAIVEEAAGNESINITDDYTFDFNYLDLVDTSNGNAYVTMGDGQKMTLFWPYPEGFDDTDTFYIAHFNGLDRNYDDLKTALESANIDLYSEDSNTYKLDKTENGIKITVNSFSPFALVYDADQGSGGNTGGGGTTGGGTTPNPPALNTEDHFSYVVGYEDGMVKPENAITRAEVASIFYRLLKDDVRDANTTDVSEFSDVSASDWYGTTVATLSAMDIVRGYEDGTFRPNAPITRAEFAAIATRFFEETGAEYEPGTFDDVTGDEWFANAIADAVELGLIGGYPDGTVRPNNNITRAEACAIVNRTLGRIPHVDHLLPADEMTTWPDNNPSDWFYADMQEATNGHEYEWTTEQGQKVEEWTEILDKDWEDR